MTTFALLLAGCGANGLAAPWGDGGLPVSDAGSMSSDGASLKSPGPPDAAAFDAAQVPLPELSFYDGESNLGDVIIDAAPDEAHNIWAVSSSALYILRWGESKFRRYTNQDGLHISYGITAVAGGRANEGFVGLEGYVSDDPDNDPSELKRLGKAEHVRLLPDGTITSLHYADLHNDNSANYWENRSARRMLFAHEGPNAGHLFVGFNHGVDNIVDDTWGDHIHVGVFWQPENSLCIGEWYGLALDPATGGLWTCGRYSCGLQRFYADPKAWVEGTFQYAFTVFTSHHSLDVPHGYREDLIAVTVAEDGSVYFLSSTFGLASWNPTAGTYAAIRPLGIPGLGLPIDVVADPDGTLWLADSEHVMRWYPASNQTTTLSLPASDIRRLYLDRAASPRALYVSTGGGLAVYRGQ